MLDAWGDLAATARVVSLTKAGPGLPLFHHCRIFADETELLDPDNNVVEISRLAMSRRYKRRPENGVPERRDVRRQAFLTLLKASTRRPNGWRRPTGWRQPKSRCKGWSSSTGFPFRVIGPQVNYGGPVAPYLMNLAEFDKTILSGRIPILKEFLDGLEPEFHPLHAPAWDTGSFDVSNPALSTAWSRWRRDRDRVIHLAASAGGGSPIRTGDRRTADAGIPARVSERSRLPRTARGTRRRSRGDRRHQVVFGDVPGSVEEEHLRALFNQSAQC